MHKRGREGGHKRGEVTFVHSEVPASTLPAVRRDKPQDDMEGGEAAQHAARVRYWKQWRAHNATARPTRALFVDFGGCDGSQHGIKECAAWRDWGCGGWRLGAQKWGQTWYKVDRGRPYGQIRNI